MQIGQPIDHLSGDDMIVREDSYRLVSAIAAKTGQSEIVWKQVANVVQQTEKVSLCRGLIAGLQAQ